MKKKKVQWKVVKFNNRRIFMRKTRSGLIKLLFKRLSESGDEVITTPLLLSPLAMDALCGSWSRYREALTQTEPLPAHPGCCDICDTGGCCKEESEEE